MINKTSKSFQIEQESFFSDKCPNCMRYLNAQGKCEFDWLHDLINKNN